MCLLAVGLAYGYVTWRNGQINRIGVNGLIGGQNSAQPMTILLVGSDTRANLKTAQDKKTFGVVQDAGGQRSDTLMLLHLDPATKSASLMSIPRDLYVPIPGTNRRDRINTTFDKGPDLLIQAIHDDLGIEVNHFAEVDFSSFRGIVNSVGQVHIYFPTPARDTYSGLNITRAGCYGLNGDQSLSYVRSRHYEYYIKGSWHNEAESDLARIRRQQDFIKKMAKKSVAQGLTSPLKLNGVIASLASNLTVDSGFHLSDMVGLAKRYRSFDPNNLISTTLPTTPAVIGGGDVLLLKQPDAQQMIDGFLGVSPAPTATTLPIPSNITPAGIRVKVENGSGRNGQANSVATALRQSGFVVTGTGAADSYRYITPVVRYATGQQDKGRYVQSLVIGGAQLQPDPTLTSADVALITGASYSGLHPIGAQAAQSGRSTGTTLAATAPTTPTTPTIPPIPGTPSDVPLPPCAP
jgi:polyisoprenyl-teichoic acid--peptidoglycan teichoic acid transferase